jgi:hypothetical protein
MAVGTWLFIGGALAFVALLCGILIVQRRKEEAAPEPPGIPPDLPGLLAWAGMRDVCRKCGQKAEGTIYKFHFGVYMKPLFGFLRTTEYLYNVQGEASVFICDECVKRKVARISLRNAVLVLPLSVFVLALFLFRVLFISKTTVQDTLTRSGWFGIVFVVALMVFSCVSLYRVFRPNTRRPTGEHLAIKLLRYPIRRRSGATHFWDTYEFGRLRPWPGDRRARGKLKR